MRNHTKRQQLDTSSSLTLAYVARAVGVNVEFIGLLPLDKYVVKLTKQII